MKIEGLRFRIFTRRWNHEDSYHVDLTDTGWYVGHIAINGECSPDGEPFLSRNLDQDNVRYSRNELAVRMLLLWQRSQNENLGKDEVQAGLTEIGNWVSASERAPQRTRKKRR